MIHCERQLDPYNHMCALTYAIHRGAMLTVSVPLQESPHETATWAETRESRGHGIWPRRPDSVVLSCLTSILSCPPTLPARLNLAQPSLPQIGGLRRGACKHAYKSPVCIAPEGSSVWTPWSSREQSMADYLGAMVIWVSQQVSVWICVAQLVCMRTVLLFCILCMPNHEWLVCILCL